MNGVEVVVAGLLALGGLRSLVRWLGADFRPASLREHVLYALHAGSRVALWFAFAAFFLGYALVDEPQLFGWYALVPLGLAAVQLLSGVLLGRSAEATRGTSPDE